MPELSETNMAAPSHRTGSRSLDLPSPASEQVRPNAVMSNYDFTITHTGGLSSLSVTGNETDRIQVIVKLPLITGQDFVDRVHTGCARSAIWSELQ